MKKHFCIISFTLSYAIILSLIIECLLYLLGLTFGISLDSYEPMSAEPIFFPLCIIAGILALLAIVAIFLLNFIKSERLGYTRKMWCAQGIFAIVGAVLLMKPWEILLDYLIKIL